LLSNGSADQLVHLASKGGDTQPSARCGLGDDSHLLAGADSLERAFAHAPEYRCADQIQIIVLNRPGFSGSSST